MENLIRTLTASAALPRNGHTASISVDARHMARALQLARKGLGRTSPNPAVGAVIVKAGRIISQGYHRRAGAPHAEVEALRRAGSKARGATLYTTLEPCNHSGRTPPCCEAILASGLSRIVIAANDPNPRTNGRGITRLRRAGLRVVTGVLEREVARLNEPFRKVMRTGMPYVLAKVGQSLDGKIATVGGESRWITSPEARRLSHQLRSRVDAILVGVNTVVQDDPLLTVRGTTHRPNRPIKIIVDSRLRTRTTARCLSAQSPAPTLIATTVRAGRAYATLQRRGIELLTLPAARGRVPLRRLCRLLARRGIQSILIEGGGEVLASALAERIVDRVAFFVAPILIGGRTAPGSFGGVGTRRLGRSIRLDEVRYRRVGSDLLIEARVRYPTAASAAHRAAPRAVRRTS